MFAITMRKMNSFDKWKILVLNTNTMFEPEPLGPAFFQNLKLGDHIIYTFDFSSARVGRIITVTTRGAKKVWVKILPLKGEKHEGTAIQIDKSSIQNVICKLKRCTKHQ